MAFKTVEQYNDERYRNMFRLVNDKDYADVVFLYTSRKDMLEADVHYIRSEEYSGYVHCCDDGCPACEKGIRKQPKIFIPLYNIKKDAIEFWDRTPKFEPQFKHDVFDKFPNPSEYVFTVVRHGAANDRDTRYSITAAGRNTVPGMSYADILAKFKATFPDYYENIIKAVSADKLASMLADNDNGSVTQDYVPVPRAGYQSSIPDTYVNALEAVSGSATVENSYVPTASDDVDSEDIGDLPDPIF